MFNKKFMLVLSLILIFSSVSLAFENTLQNYGFNGIEIIGPDQKICQTFTIPKSIEQGHGILSIRSEFIGEVGDNTYVTISFNEGKENLIWTENFICVNNCVARVFTPILSEDILTTICLNSGGKTSYSKIFANSSIGTYNSPVLEIEHNSPGQIVLGERARMQIKIKNSGNLPADVFVQFLAEDLRSFLKITSFDIVEGDASARVTINPNEEKEFFYYIKPTQSSSYNLPSAVLSFTNIFNENQKIASSHPPLIVLDQEQINLILISEKLSDDKFSFKLLIKNNWNSNFVGNLELAPFDLIDDYNSVLLLRPFEEKEILLQTKNLNAGKYSILATIDSNNKFFASESLEFLIDKKDYSFEILFSTIAILIAAVIFAWIYFQKN